MHFENASPEARRAERDGGPDDDDALLADVDGGLLADVDGGLLAEPPHAAIATEQTTAGRMVRVTIDDGSLRGIGAVMAIPGSAARNEEQDLQSLHRGYILQRSKSTLRRRPRSARTREPVAMFAVTIPKGLHS